MFVRGLEIEGSSPGRDTLTLKIKGGVSVRRAGLAAVPKGCSESLRAELATSKERARAEVTR